MSLEKIPDVLRAVADEHVDYVLIGAVAMMAHGLVRATEDMDFFARPHPDNIDWRIRLPIQRFRSLKDIETPAWVEPGTPLHRRSLRAVLWMVSWFAPKRQLPRGVFRFRSAEESFAQRIRWEDQSRESSHRQ